MEYCGAWAEVLFSFLAFTLTAKLLDSEHVPLVVGISGIVYSETPINCEFGGLRGVIVEQWAEQKFLKRNVDGDWRSGSDLMLSTCKEVPWYLDDGTGRVNVVGAQGASGFNLPASHGVFEQSRRCLKCETTDYRPGLKVLGVKRTEWVLPVGTSLSVVGEAVKDAVGTIRIPKPHDGPFYVSPKSIDELIASRRNCGRFLKYASFGLAFIGLTLIALEFNENITGRQRRFELQRSLTRAVSAVSVRPGKDNEGSGEGAVDANGTNSCVICLEQEFCFVFVPCGHMCCCTSCCLNLRKCPLCRQQIVQVVRTFRP
ncbi:E3 ubiquitin-protein ligase SP1-like [Prunus dulcis]|uniref:E3 ubiquitin-protein ligase SP1-like n=1 Tax=Prunus dulcis TaxID=3755 RepID=UPI0014833CD0|nr:E3 ubiquitin-protein ligase SP1-like [Prunus dulcis]